jgi:hypothetical protein
MNVATEPIVRRVLAPKKRNGRFPDLAGQKEKKNKNLFWLKMIDKR